MYLEAVSVCVNYSDYLSHCISNKEQLDRWVIVTIKEDDKTIKLCESNDLEYVISKRVYHKRARFAKGKAINDGFSVLEKRDWLAHIDGDIKLEKDFREKVEKLDLNTNCLYSTRGRYMIRKKEDLEKKKKHLDYFIMKSWAGKKKLKEVHFLGYLQLFHSSKFKKYPEKSTTCRIDDIAFRDHFSKHNRKLIDVDLFHYGLPCVNWYGRQTPEF